MALCEKKLGHYARAIKPLEQYGVEGRGRLSEKDRTEAVFLIEKMRAFVSTLRLTSNVQGASVFVDEEQVGTTPLTRPLLPNRAMHRAWI